MTKLTKQQKRKKKIQTKAKNRLTQLHELNRTAKKPVAIPIMPLIQVDHESIFKSYLTVEPKDREKFLNDTYDQYGFMFNSDTLLELIIDEIKDNHGDDQEFLSILTSPTLKWYEIANEIERYSLDYYATLMRPVIVFGEYETDI